MHTPFTHRHPYEPFLFEQATRWIVGTLPPPRFSTGELLPGDVDFCYGSRDGLLWPILDRVFGLGLDFETTPRAVAQRKAFLRDRGIGICDIVEQAQRRRVDASDLGMENIRLRDLVGLLGQNPGVETLLFTGGNSKNGPEYLFRKSLKGTGLRLQRVSAALPRIHSLDLGGGRHIRTVSLIAPSGSANRAIGSMSDYKARKAANPDYTVMDYRAEQYRKYF